MSIYKNVQKFPHRASMVDGLVIRVHVDDSSIVSRYAFDAVVANIGIYKSHKYITNWMRDCFSHKVSQYSTLCMDRFLSYASILDGMPDNIEIGYAYFVEDRETGLAVMAARGIDSGD